MASNQSQRTAQLKELFRDVAPIEITGTLDLSNKTPQEIAALLPRFTTLQQQGENPAFGILVDSTTGRMWSLRSGFQPEVEQVHKGIRYKSGSMTKATAEAAGQSWGQRGNPLGAHLEGQAAAVMRKMDIMEARLYMNALHPCYGRLPNGCQYRLPELLAEDAELVVFGKNGNRFNFTGLPD